MKRFFVLATVSLILGLCAIQVQASSVTVDFTFYLDPDGSQGSTQRMVLHDDGTWDSPTYPWSGKYFFKNNVLKMWGDRVGNTEAFACSGIVGEPLLFANWFWPSQTSGVNGSGYIVYSMVSSGQSSNSVQKGQLGSGAAVDISTPQAILTTLDFTFYIDPDGHEGATQTMIAHDDGTWDSPTYPWSGRYYYNGTDVKIWGDRVDNTEAFANFFTPAGGGLLKKGPFADWFWPAQTSGVGGSGYTDAVVVPSSSVKTPPVVSERGNLGTALQRMAPKRISNLTTTWGKMKK